MRTVGQRLARSPGWQLVAGGVLLALLFPSRFSGAIGMAIAAGGFGVAVAQSWDEFPAWLRKPPPRIAGAIVVAIVVLMGVSTFWDTLADTSDWPMWDWGPQHAVLQRAMSSLPGLDVPVWNHIVGTGDAPFELYPKLTYVVTGHIALALGLEGELPHAMMVTGVIVYVATAAGTTMLAMRVAPKPIALVVGVLTLVDSGAVAHGGTVGLFRWGLLHSAMSLMFAVFAAIGVLAMLRKPRMLAAVAIWIFTALACATHPAGLIGAAASIVALATVALLAHDVPARRPLIAAGHVALGVALGAAVWMPLAERILLYGQHFPNAVWSPARLVEHMLQNAWPVTAFAMLGYAGYFGIIAGLWSRKARTVYVSAAALVLLVGLCDAPYLALDLAPGQGIARLGTERLAQLARPFLAACGAYTIWIVIGHAIESWRGAKPNQRLVAAAVIGVMTAMIVRVVPSVWRSTSTRAYGETQVLAPDPQGRAELAAWAREQVAATRPDSWARAVFDSDTHEHFHLTAETGLPTFHITPQPDLLLRERIEDLSPESLRRFNVRWAIASGRSPTLGNPDTERTIGGFTIRDIDGWDGKFARIERGTGEVRVTRLDDRAVEIEVTAQAPVLVALGTGYYPRWRARHASGTWQPVYALPAKPEGRLHVVSAWVSPGKTTFTPDGPLPSDGKGTPFAILAALAAIAGLVVWRIPRWRRRVLRRIARVHMRLPQWTKLAAKFGIPLLLLALLVRGCVDDGLPTKALLLGSGVRATATVEARLDGGPWQRCDYQRLQGAHVCDGMLVAYDGMTNLLNDAPPSWAFSTPGIVATADIPGIEMRVLLDERLKGTYWSAVSEGTVTLEVSGEQQQVYDRKVITYGDRDGPIEIRAKVPMTFLWFTFVREDTLVPERDHLDPPPETAP
ncbi:MAG TPA: hypothetical protein VIU61_28510 [Kofleriaceae bacterium]